MSDAFYQVRKRAFGVDGKHIAVYMLQPQKNWLFGSMTIKLEVVARFFRFEDAIEYLKSKKVKFHHRRGDYATYIQKHGGSDSIS